MNIRSKFITSLMAGVIIPVVVITFIAVLKFEENAVSSFEQQSINEIRQIDNAFTLYLNGLAEDALFFSKTK